MKKVCLITPGHISTNPRLVKEATSLSQAGFKVHIVFTQYIAGQVKYDTDLLTANPEWTYNVLNWTGTSYLSKLNRLLYKLSAVVSKNQCNILNRNFAWQVKKAILFKADLYIAHNLGALPAAVQAAKKNNALVSFDAEDFHRHEVTDDISSADVRFKTAIEDKYIPQLNYFTASSPEIAGAYQKLFPFLNPVVLLNVFPKSLLSIKADTHPEQTQLVWFSQTIGLNRGLENIINAMRFLNNPQIQLHLLGNISSSSQPILDLIKQNNIAVVFHDTLPPNQVINFCSQFDIGLALEPAFSPNNNMALSNKLFTYMQAGLTTIASDTLAQKKFINEHLTAGRIYPKGDYEALAKIIHFYHNNRTELVESKKAALQLAHNEFNWETESIKFISLIKRALV